jgi:hypothetical protein
MTDEISIALRAGRKIGLRSYIESMKSPQDVRQPPELTGAGQRGNR